MDNADISAVLESIHQMPVGLLDVVSLIRSTGAAPPQREPSPTSDTPPAAVFKLNRGSNDAIHVAFQAVPCHSPSYFQILKPAGSSTEDVSKKLIVVPRNRRASW